TRSRGSSSSEAEDQMLGGEFGHLLADDAHLGLIGFIGRQLLDLLDNRCLCLPPRCGRSAAPS
ncbi:MAG TPA: hypothetical protein VF504_07495, partial [Solirubrobacterales bacterium]